MRKLNFAPLLGLLIALLLLAGCSHDPSDKVIRDQISAQLLDNKRDQIYEVKNFTKTNGWSEGDYYVVQVEYDLLYKTDLSGAMHILQGEDGSMFGGGLSALALGMAYGDFKAGDIHHVTEEYSFIKTEKGWRLKQK